MTNADVSAGSEVGWSAFAREIALGLAIPCRQVSAQKSF